MTSPVTSNQNTSNPSATNLSAQDAKNHYDSLVSLLKYGVTLMSTFIAVIGVLVGYLTYTNGEEMRSSFEAERNVMKAAVNEMQWQLEKDEIRLNKKEDRMEKTVDRVIEITTKEIEAAEKRALNKINEIDNIASTEARKRINEIFDSRNLSQFVDSAFDKRVAPQVQTLVNNKFSQDQQEKKERTDRLLNDLSSPDENIFGPAYTYLILNNAEKLTDEQIQKVIEAIKIENKPDAYKAGMANILLFQHSKPATEYFMGVLRKEHDNNQGMAVAYLIRTKEILAPVYYTEIITRVIDKMSVFEQVVKQSATYDRTLLFAILNNVSAVDAVNTQTSFDALRPRIAEDLKRKQITGYENTYFFTKK